MSTILLLAILGYAGGVYYSLISDNFHDFFCEYIPFGEDVVAYFEDRQFQKRFSNKSSITNKLQPSTRGEEKVTIGKNSGITARNASENKMSDLGKSGRHSSALEDDKNTQTAGPKADKPVKKQVNPVTEPKADDTKTQTIKTEKRQSAENKDLSKEKSMNDKSLSKEKNVKDKTPSNPVVELQQPSKPSPLIDHVALPNATEPVVQASVKLLNDLITVINADSNGGKYSSSVEQAKSQLTEIISSIDTLKKKVIFDAEEKIKNNHLEFDNAAKELVSRVEKEMANQQIEWREEYETERQTLAKTYQSKLETELNLVQQSNEQKVKTALVEQQIAMNRQYAQSVKNHVELERQGRLSKLDTLSSSVDQLESLTKDWTSVLTSTLSTQHLHVALEAVKAAISCPSDNHKSIPFVTELSALKDVAGDDELITAAISSITPSSYQKGIPNPSSLIDRFRRVASQVRKAALLPEDAGVASHAASALLSKFVFTKKAGAADGEDVEAIISRTEGLLEQGDLDAATREMNGLKGWASVLSKDWIEECRKVLEVKQALDVSHYRYLLQHAYD